MLVGITLYSVYIFLASQTTSVVAHSSVSSNELHRKQTYRPIHKHMANECELVLWINCSKDSQTKDLPD